MELNPNKPWCPTCGGAKDIPLSPCVGGNTFNAEFHTQQSHLQAASRSRLTVYKSLDANYKSTFQGFAFPLPIKLGGIGFGTAPAKKVTYEPGPWLEIEGDPVLCTRGFHGWIKKEKAFREGAHVYEMELEGKYLQDHEKACSTRARLVKEIFEQPQEPWEEFVSRETSALAIVEEARGLRVGVSTVDLTKNKLVAGYYPVVPAYHLFRENPEKLGRCGDCGLNEFLHDGWEDRNALAAKLNRFDRWELVLYIQQILAGKDNGLDIVKADGS